MGYNHEWPYVDPDRANTDWEINTTKDLIKKVKEFIAANRIKIANPIQWDITRQYEANTLVIYGETGDAYLSVQPVPAGFDLTHVEYWMKVFTLGNQLATVENGIAYNEGNASRASRDYAAGDLLWVNDFLYEAIIPIPEDTLFDVDHNIRTVVLADIIASIREELSLLRNRKFLFIGDSYNTAAHHGGWGAGVIDKLGLTLGVNAWNTGLGGASFHYGTFLSQAQALAATMTEDEKNTITDVVLVGAINDWSAGDGELISSVQAMESYVHTTFPNAKYWIILGGWSYELDAIREGAVHAYNIIVENSDKATVIDDAFMNFLDPAFLETDMVHPTSSGMALLVTSICNILQGGKSYLKTYTDLNTMFSGIKFSGEITKSGVHIWAHHPQGFPLGGTVTVPQDGNSPLVIGTADTVNNLFERNADFIAMAMYGIGGTTFKTGLVRCRVTKNETHSWSLSVASIEIIDGEADYPVHNVTYLSLFFDTVLPYYAN